MKDVASQVAAAIRSAIDRALHPIDARLATLGARLSVVEHASEGAALREYQMAGPPGIQGTAGKDGSVGARGPAGARGELGPQGEIGPMPRHRWRGTELQFELQPDVWGSLVDVKGDRGPAGAPGGSGRSGFPNPNVVGRDGGTIRTTRSTNSYMPAGW